MRRSVILRLLAIGVSAIAFSIVAGISEYLLITRGDIQISHDGGVTFHPITRLGAYSVSLDTALYAAPIGALTSVILAGILLVFGSKSRPPRFAAPRLGYALGCALLGAFLSLVAWVVLGGWGPYFLLPSFCAGAALGTLWYHLPN